MGRGGDEKLVSVTDRQSIEVNAKAQQVSVFKPIEAYREREWIHCSTWSFSS